jgi:N-acetylglucosamine kinase-like BadF-type ATPase
MKKDKQYIIGVDGGGTKTIAALANLRGEILAKSKSRSSNPRNIGIKEAVFNLTQVISQLCKQIKKNDEIISTFIGLPAVEEEYRDRKAQILKLLQGQKEIFKIFKGKVIISSDQIVSFRSGANQKDGVLLIAGTGSVCHGWRGKKEAKAGGWGWLNDEGSAFWIGQKAFQAILKGLDGRGPRTLLTKLAFQKFRTNKITDFLKEIYSQNPTEIISQFSIICDKASQKGDKVAKKIMIEAGIELALTTIKVIRELNFQKIKFPLVLVGSVFNSKIILNQIKKRIKKIAPEVQFIRPKKEPVIGAIKLAIEKI